MSRATSSSSHGSKFPPREAKATPAKQTAKAKERLIAAKSSGGAALTKVAQKRTRLGGAARLKLTPLNVYRATPTERMAVIKAGLPAIAAKRFLSALGMQQATVLNALALPTATINKKAKQQANLSPGDSERVVGLAKLVGQVEAMVRESGNPEGFDAAAWMSRWMQEPQPALGGGRPIDMIDTMEGQSLVSTVLAQMQSGAYA